MTICKKYKKQNRHEHKGTRNRKRFIPGYFCNNEERLIKVFPNVVKDGAQDFLCFSHPISGYQAIKPNRIGCKMQKKKIKKYAQCCSCYRTFKIVHKDTTNKLGYYSNLDFQHDKVYSCFSTPNVQNDRRIRRLDPNLKYRRRPIKLQKNSKDLCPGICKTCLKHGY